MSEHQSVDALGQAVALGEPPIIEASSRTDVGVHRRVNEDSVFAGQGVYIVADGMGGHEAGDLASAAAIEPFRALAERNETRDYHAVEAAIELARRGVDAVSLSTERGAGCTLTGIVLIEHEGIPHWYVLNVGDSRVYLHTGVELTQLTIDHSLHAELLAEGRPEAKDTPRNVITRALGSGDARHDAWLLPLRTGSRILICSDGLTTEIADEEIMAVLAVGGRPDAVADELIRLACAAGGRDNISVVIVDTVSAGSRANAFHADEDEAAHDETIEVTRPVLR